MTPLRKRMTEAMQIRNLAVNTQPAYLQQIAALRQLLSAVTRSTRTRAGTGLPAVSDE